MNDLIPAEQTYKINIQNKREKPLVFGTEPQGFYSDIDPDKTFDVVIIDDEKEESFYLSEKEWGQEDILTITHWSAWLVYVYLDDMLLSHSNGPEKHEFDNPDNGNQIKYKFRFVNECENEVIFGIEPFGLFYDIPGKSQLELAISQMEYESLDMVVQDSSILLYLPSVEITISIDGNILFP